MELKVQGSLLTEGIIDAILARTDGVEAHLCAIGCDAVALFGD